MKYLLNCRNFYFLIDIIFFFDNFGMDEDYENFNYKFDVLLVGDTNVGKTAIINNLLENKFDDEYKATISPSFMIKTVKFDDKIIKLYVWDTSGQEKFMSVTKIFCKDVHLIVLVYAVDDKDTFKNIQKWVDNLKIPNENAKFLLVGNKCDLEDNRQVSAEEAQKYAGNNNMKFIEVSAKKGTNIGNMFDSILPELLKDEEEKEKNNHTHNNTSNNFEHYNSIDDIKNKKTSFCNKYCSCCPCLEKTEKNNEDSDNEEEE